METKRCAGWCGLERPVEDFRWKQKAKGIRVSWCRTCDSRRRAERYNPDNQKKSYEAYLARRKEKVAAGLLLEGDFKVCFACGKPFPTEVFRWRDESSGLRVGRCPKCDRNWRARDYRDKSEAYKARINKLHEDLRAIVVAAKQAPCKDCGVTYPSYVMDFDHRDPSQKVANVSKVMRLGSRRKLLAEIAKCDLVCANCHRERTHRQQNGDNYG